MRDDGLGLVDVMPVGGTYFYHFVHAISRRRQLLRHRLVAEILDFDESLARGWSRATAGIRPVDDGSGMAKGIEHVGLIAKGYPIGVRTTIFHAISVTETSTWVGCAVLIEQGELHAIKPVFGHGGLDGHTGFLVATGESGILHPNHKFAVDIAFTLVVGFFPRQDAHVHLQAVGFAHGVDIVGVAQEGKSAVLLRIRQQIAVLCQRLCGVVDPR